MSLFVDLQAVQRPESGERGIGRYSVELTRALLADGPVAGVGLNPLLPRPEPLPGDLHLDPHLVWTTAREVRRVTGGEPFAHLTLSPMEGGCPAESVFPVWLEDEAVAGLAVVYDIIPYLFPEHYMPARSTRAFFEARELTLRQADRLLAISEYTRRDVIRHWGIEPRRVVTIGSGAAPYFHPPEDDDAPAQLLRPELPAIRGPFVLSVAGYDWRKNAETLIDAWASLPATARGERQLVVTCRVPDEVAAAWTARAVDGGLRAGDIVITGFVSDAVLRALYQAAELLVFPSRYEGFGLPVLEAARCGTPSITSDRTSLPEILDLPASTFDPDDVADIARVLGRVLTDPDTASEVAEASQRAAERHTWERVADRVREVAAEVVPSAGRRPDRIAVVGGPGRRDRIAARLACDRAVVEAFGPGATPLEVTGGLHTFDSFDRVVAVVDEAITLRALEACERADVVVLATESLVEARIGWLRDRYPDEVAGALAVQMLEDAYAGMRPHGTAALDLLDPAAWERSGLALLGPLARNAGVVVAVAPLTGERVRLEAGPGARASTVTVTEDRLVDAVAAEIGLTLG